MILICKQFNVVGCALLKTYTVVQAKGIERAAIKGKGFKRKGSSEYSVHNIVNLQNEKFKHRVANDN